jgi:hypothetical protein
MMYDDDDVQARDTFFGAVIFDDQNMPGNGWVSIEGDTPYRIVDQSQLPTNTIFWSNCSYNAYWYTHRGKLVSHLRCADYLPIKPGAILKTWGADPAMVRPDQYAVIMASVFSRMMKMARGLMRNSELGLRESMFFVSDKLTQDIKTILPQAEFPRDDSEINSILRKGIGFDYFTTTSVLRRKDAQMITVGRPRIDHAIEIMSSPVPNGPFAYHRGKDLPPAGELSAISKPVMAEIIMHRSDPTISSIYGFGITSGRNNKVQRNWVAHPELAIMSGFSDIEIRGAMIGESYGVLSQSITNILRKFFTAKESSLSWSAGAVIDAIWGAAAVGKTFSGALGTKEQTPQTSWRGAWLRATDKVVTLRYAMQLHRENFAVLSYSNGQITCAVTPERREEFILTSWRLGLVPPIYELPRQFTDTELATIPWGGDPNSKFWATLMLTKNSKALWELDNLPVASEEEKREILVNVQTMVRENYR